MRHPTLAPVKKVRSLDGTFVGQASGTEALLEVGGPSFALADHADHIHAGDGR